MTRAYFALAIFPIILCPLIIFESNPPYFVIILTNKVKVNTDNNVPATTIIVA